MQFVCRSHTHETVACCARRGDRPTKTRMPPDPNLIVQTVLSWVIPGSQAQASRQGPLPDDYYNEKGSVSRRSPFHLLDQADYAQVITPFVMLHVLADCVCVAVAFHEGGGPGASIATIVTFCDGVNPWRGAAIVAVPPK